MENDKTSGNQSLELANTSFDSFKSLEDMLKFGATICKSRLSPLDTPQDVVAALLMGKELGMGVMVSINNIYPINGKASSGIHIIAGQLLKAGISNELLSDNEPVFNIAIEGITDAEGKKTVIVVKKEPYSYTLKEGEHRGKTIVDRVTIIKFNRLLKQPNGEYIPMETISKFYKSDIPNGYLDGPKAKDNWLNWMPVMMYTRCFTNGAKRIGDDVILGLYETSELADLNNIPCKIVDGVVTIIHSGVKPTEKTNSSIEEATIEETTQKA